LLGGWTLLSQVVRGKINRFFPYVNVVSTSIFCVGSRISYSEDLAAGPKYLRIWQLSFRSDFGMPGMADPFDLAALMELILLNGLLGSHEFFPCNK